MSTDYFTKLDPPTPKQQKEKLEVIKSIDRYPAPDSHFSVKTGNFSSICYPDINNHLVLARVYFLLMTLGFIRASQL